MDDMAKKLSELLSTPEGMDKIKTIMGMFLDTGGTGDKAGSSAPAAQEEPESSQEPIAKIAPIENPFAGGSNTLGFNLNNPAMLAKIASVFEVMNTKDDSRINLLMSLKPFLGQKRGSRLDQAVKMLQISKLSSLMKK